MTTKIFTNEDFSVVAPTTDGSTPTGTLAAWAVLQERVISATTVSATGSTITAVFAGGLPVGGGWTFYISEAIGGGPPGVISEQAATITNVTRP